jgi:Tol biopolymer transport system component
MPQGLVHKVLTLGLLVLLGSCTSEIKKQSLPDSVSILSHIRQFSFAGPRASDGYFGPLGKYFVFQSEREPHNPFCQIYITNLQTAKVTRLSSDIGQASSAWIHPGGQRVLFASTHADPEAPTKEQQEFDRRKTAQAPYKGLKYDAHYEIYSADPKAPEDIRNLSNTLGYDAEASYSPDGTKIVFASNRHAYTKHATADIVAHRERDPSAFIDIYMMNTDGTNMRRLTTSHSYDGEPTFSPQGHRIAWKRFSEDGSQSEIWTMDTDGSNQRMITELGAVSSAPFYHPSGDYIIFTTNLHAQSNFELHIVDSRGKHLTRRVTQNPGFDGHPAFTPDGLTLSWTRKSQASNGSQIFMASWSHKAALSRLGLPQPTKRANKYSTPDGLVTPLIKHVTRLTKPSMGGRDTGSDGAKLAAEYVARAFGNAGLLPESDDGSYFQTFQFTSENRLGPYNTFALHQGSDIIKLDLGKDWRPLHFSKEGHFIATDIVFAGYGLNISESNDFPAYDSYDGLDIHEKWVMILSGSPEKVEGSWQAHLARHATLRNKVTEASKRGALGVLVTRGTDTNATSELIALETNALHKEASIAVISINDTVTSLFFAHVPQTLVAMHKELNQGKEVSGINLGTQPFNIWFKVWVDFDRRQTTGINIVGKLPASPNKLSSSQALLIGAHIDGQGYGIKNSSLATSVHRYARHPGANDNASGVAALIEIAKHLAASSAERIRPIIFAAWTGESNGLLGSGHYAETLHRQQDLNHLKTSASALNPLDQPNESLANHLVAYLNLDTVGRLDNQLLIQDAGSSPDWPILLEGVAMRHKMALVLSQKSHPPTDAVTFYRRRVPVLNAFTGAHQQTHTPRDTSDLLNYPGLARITRFYTDLAQQLSARPTPILYSEITKP